MSGATSGAYCQQWTAIRGATFICDAVFFINVIRSDIKRKGEEGVESAQEYSLHTKHLNINWGENINWESKHLIINWGGVRLSKLFRGYLAPGYIARDFWLYSQELYSQRLLAI